MKRVFSSADQVLHLWAHQAQSDARSSNVFFEGRSCYSYGRHYELGRLVQYKGKTVALINDRGYSNTTAKHISWAFSAVSHLPRLKLDFSSMAFNVDESMVRAALERQENALCAALSKHFTERSAYLSLWVDKYGSCWLKEQVDEFNSLCDTLKETKRKILVDEDFILLWNEHSEYFSERARELKERRKTPEYLAEQEQRRAKEEARAAKKHAANIEAWRAGGPLTQDIRDLRIQLMRISGNEVETSRGARVPVSHAVRLLRLYDAGKLKAGERVGHFSVSSISNNDPKKFEERSIFIHIGCHVFSLEEARRVLSNIPAHLTLVPVNEEQTSEGVSQ